MDLGLFEWLVELSTQVSRGQGELLGGQRLVNQSVGGTYIPSEAVLSPICGGGEEDDMLLYNFLNVINRQVQL